MRILCFNTQTPEKKSLLELEDARDILARRAANPNIAVAACWEKLLELVDRLCELGPSRDIHGMITDYGYELAIFTPENSVVTIRADRFDYGPCIKGIPIFHFRMEVKADNRIVRETRRETANEMAAILLGELGHGND